MTIPESIGIVCVVIGLLGAVCGLVLFGREGEIREPEE
jgi:hypothetical protein